jgi:putative copper resistance protein D
MEPLDASQVGQILVKASGYAASLLAAGGAFFVLVFSDLPRAFLASVRRATVVLALAAAVLAGVGLAAHAAFLGGGSIESAFDPALLGLVVEGPPGASSALRAIGVALVVALLFEGRWAGGTAAVGAVLVAASYALVGHTVSGEPRLVLGALLTVHLVGVAFWIGALWPLYRCTGAMPPAEAGRLLERFGRIAVAFVGALVVAGAAIGLLLTGGIAPLVESEYGWTLLAKLALVAGLLALAALNKLRLSPAVRAGAPGAAGSIRVSIRAEMALVALILLVTAVLTTLVSPEGVHTH